MTIGGVFGSNHQALSTVPNEARLIGSDVQRCKWPVLELEPEEFLGPLGCQAATTPISFG